MIRKILVATDFSDDAARATAHGANLAKLFGAQLELFSAYHVSTASLGEAAEWVPPSFFERFADSTRERLEREAAPLRTAGLDVSCSASADVPSHAIAARAREIGADLVAVGTRGHTGLPHILLGSVAERVARIAPCPVLCTRQDHPAPGPIRKILVATDFSPAAAAALEWARELAAKSGGSLLLVHCVPPAFGVGEDEIAEDDAWTRERIEHGRERLAEIGRSGETQELVRGHPYTSALELGQKRGIDLAVFGTRARAGFGDLLLGNNAERAVQRSSVPTVLVKETSSAQSG